ncbi:MAG: radical SAM protein [Candidatus Woesearchaeota archaeon]
MKILLVNPPAANGLRCIREGRCEQRADSFQYLMTPISLPSIASVLQRDGFVVMIVDCIADNISFDALKSIISKESPALVVVNVATVSFNTDIQVAQLCKSQKIPVAAYGVHVTTTSEETMKSTSFDFLIRGEPEIICLYLVKALRDKNDLASVKGISFRRQGVVVYNAPAPLIDDLDSLPFPDRTLLHNELYIAPLSHKPYTLIIASRGCPYSCIYCTAHQYYGRKPRSRSADNILEEIRHVVEKLHIRYIAMWSDTFTLNKQFVLELCYKIIASGLDFEWYCNSRVDTIDDEMIKIMAKAHCKVITLGVESLDQSILDRMKKRITVAQIERAISICRLHGIKTQAHLIFGLPGETAQSIKRTIKGIKHANPDYAEFYCAVPFPGTEFHDLMEKQGYITTKDYSRYELNQAIVSYPTLSDKDIKNALIQAYRAFYLRPSYVWRKVREFPLRDWPSIGLQAISWAKNWIFG